MCAALSYPMKRSRDEIAVDSIWFVLKLIILTIIKSA